MNSVELYPAAAAITVVGVGKTATLRKLSALDQVQSRASLLILKRVKGKVGKAATVLDAAFEDEMIVRLVGAGDFHAFAVAYLGTTGRNVTFGAKDAKGVWITKPSADFRSFGAILRHEHAQLGDKAFDSKGYPSTASAALLGLLDTHARSVALMDEAVAVDNERRARLAAEQTTLAIAAELDRIDAEIEAGETI